MAKGDDKVWFPAKRYGWGWGLPRAWQGWTALICCLTIGLLPLMMAITNRGTGCGPLAGGGIRNAIADFSCHRNDFWLRHFVIGSVLWLVVWLGILTVISYKKGAPPQWRWGSKEQ